MGKANDVVTHVGPFRVTWKSCRREKKGLRNGRTKHSAHVWCSTISESESLGLICVKATFRSDHIHTVLNIKEKTLVAWQCWRKGPFSLSFSHLIGMKRDVCSEKVRKFFLLPSYPSPENRIFAFDKWKKKRNEKSFSIRIDGSKIGMCLSIIEKKLCKKNTIFMSYIDSATKLASFRQKVHLKNLLGQWPLLQECLGFICLPSLVHLLHMNEGTRNACWKCIEYTKLLIGFYAERCETITSSSIQWMNKQWKRFGHCLT